MLADIDSENLFSIRGSSVNSPACASLARRIHGHATAAAAASGATTWPPSDRGRSRTGFHGRGVTGSRFLGRHDKGVQLVAIRVLLDETLTLGRTRYLGDTLWTDFRLGTHSLTHGMRSAQGLFGMIDYRRICTGPSSRHRIEPEQVLAMHRRTRAFIEATLAVPHAGPTVVVTHHAPHPDSLPDPHADMRRCYASDLRDLIHPRQRWPRGVHREGGETTQADLRQPIGIPRPFWLARWGKRPAGRHRPGRRGGTPVGLTCLCEAHNPSCGLGASTRSSGTPTAGARHQPVDRAHHLGQKAANFSYIIRAVRACRRGAQAGYRKTFVF